MKLLILVLASNDDFTMSLVNTIKSTWGQDSNDNIQIMYYYGDKDKNEIIGDDIFLTCDDSYGAPMIKKTLDALQIVYDNVDFDIMFRTNTSNYIRTKMLYSILKKYEPKDLYGGTYPNMLDYNNLSGQGMIFSKDVVGKILKNKDIKIPAHIWWEDGLITHALMHIYKENYIINYKHLKRLDIKENSLSMLGNMFSFYYNDIVAFRVKTSNPPGDRSLDVKKMLKLYDLFNK